jgi:hypothetical protein
MPTQVTRRSRRALLISAAGGAAAMATAQLARPVAALAVDVPVNLNVDNLSSALTTIKQQTAETDAFEAVGKGHGWGVKGASDLGVGVIGQADDAAAPGLVGLSGNPAGANPYDLQTGVYGFCTTGAYPNGVWGESPTDHGTGVYGEGGYGVLGMGYAGVVGVSGDNTGVHGHGGDDVWPDQPANTGVFATCAPGGVALEARGKVKFDRANKVLIKKGTSKVKRTLAGVTTTSQVFATLRTYRSGVYVAAVVPATGYFTIYLNKTLAYDTYCAYFVVN